MLMLQMLSPGTAAHIIQTFCKDTVAQDFERQSIDRMEGESSEKNLEQLARSALATPGGCSVCFAQVNTVCYVNPSVMTAVPSGNAVQSSPNPIAEDPRKALVFEEGDDCRPCIRKTLPWLNRSDVRCSSQSLQHATLLANLSRCNKATVQSASLHAPCSGP